MHARIQVLGSCFGDCEADVLTRKLHNTMQKELLKGQQLLSIVGFKQHTFSLLEYA